MQGNKELKRCSRCGSNLLLEYFERNRECELFKTCNRCRKKKTPPPIEILMGGISTATSGTNDDNISTTTSVTSDNLNDNISTTSPETSNNLVGENREIGGNLLCLDLIPRGTWFNNVRSVSIEAHWKNYKQQIYNRVEYNCECCNMD